MNVTTIEKIAAGADCPLCAVREVLSSLPAKGAWAQFCTLKKSARVKAAAGRRHTDKCQRMT